MTHWLGSRCMRSSSGLAEAPVAVTASANARAAGRNILSSLQRPSAFRRGPAIVSLADGARRRADDESDRRPHRKLLGRMDARQASTATGAAHVFDIRPAKIGAGRDAACAYPGLQL